MSGALQFIWQYNNNNDMSGLFRISASGWIGTVIGTVIQCIYIVRRHSKRCQRSGKRCHFLAQPVVRPHNTDMEFTLWRGHKTHQNTFVHNFSKC